MFRFRINNKWLVIAVLSCVLVTSSAFAISFRDTNSSTPVKIHYHPTDNTSRSNYLTQLERRSTFDTDKTSRFDYLTQIENVFNTIESTKLVTLEKSEEISNATKTYADRTKADLDIALENARLLAETEGKSGEIQSLSRFELRSLAQELGLTIVDLLATDKGLVPETWYFQGRKIPELEIINYFIPLAQKIDEDLVAIGDGDVNYRSYNQATFTLVELTH
ncbi:hypothetical protein NIES4072_11740 [Nostoc commune NIES-4072]|uniref:Uncharacterized protein n=1 Tax=Nostoc commune NIES-4072 TaxID=2005467 RepID=A0A2R5FPF8_NOSCO|nr:hypothetical protein [Nostoc commune]BBD65161.1 hypothetical protein NIES4070_15080 [Nostoc commune HK-02]GBG17514.1 hypothetical protein NIES4072_11740 [Nostoc commune NIES-4072]